LLGIHELRQRHESQRTEAESLLQALGKLRGIQY
jgi:hypothetical protein